MSGALPSYGWCGGEEPTSQLDFSIGRMSKDVAGNISEAHCRDALNHLQPITSCFRVLVSYPGEV